MVPAMLLLLLPVSANGVVQLPGGVHHEPLVITAGGTADRPLIYRAAAGETPVYEGGVVIEADHVVLDGLTITNVKPNGTGLLASHRGDVVLLNLSVTGCRIGVWILSCTDVQLRNSEVHHNRAGNVLIDTGCAGIVVADCHIHHCDEGHSLSVYSPGDGVRAQGKLTSLQATGDGLVRFGLEGVDLSKVRDGTLTGQDAEGTVAYPSTILLFATADPSPDAPPLPGGTIRMEDGRDWLPLRAEPTWGGKPYSPDGTLGQFEPGHATPEILGQARYAYIAYRFNPAVASRDIQLLRNEVDHGAVQGIWVQRAEGVLIEGNRTHDNGATGIQIESLCRRIWIEGNVSWANCVRYNHETGIWLDETIDAVVQDNVCYENQKGMGVTQCEWVLVRRNVLHHNRAQHVSDPAAGKHNSGGFWFSGGRHAHLGAPPGASHNAFVHNLLWANGDPTSTWGGFQHGIAGYPRVDGNVVLNNLILDCDGAAPLDLGAPPAALDGNVLWSPNRFTALVHAAEGDRKYNLSNPAELAAYRQATGFDSGSKVTEVAVPDLADPDFSAAGQPLARTTTAGQGRDVPVDHACCFTAGLRDRNGVVLKQGDRIRIGAATARVVRIDRGQSALSVDRELSWAAGEAVTTEARGDAE